MVHILLWIHLNWPIPGLYQRSLICHCCLHCPPCRFEVTLKIAAQGPLKGKDTDPNEVDNAELTEEMLGF